MINIDVTSKCSSAARLTPLKPDSVSIGEAILNNNYLIFPTLPKVVLEKDEIIWDYKFKRSKTTYELYLHAFYPVSYLCNAYEESGRTEFLEKAYELLDSWVTWSEVYTHGDNQSKSPVMWGDHATSNRTQALIYLAWMIEKSRYEKERINNLKKLLQIHGDYLANNDNYSAYNHGLMMDLALLLLGVCLENNQFENTQHWIDIALERVKRGLKRDLTEDGVHIENSPGYHFWLMNFIKRIKPILETIDTNKSHEILDQEHKMKEYVQYIARSNGSIPAIGDTAPNLKNVRSTIENSKHFENSNIIFMRTKDIWASFNAGYFTHVHKHQDDLSFNLNVNGKDVFFDPGFYNYEDSEFSRSFKAASAHNTLTIEDESYKIIKKDLTINAVEVEYENSVKEMVGIDYSYLDEYFDHVSGFNNSYDQGDIRRSIVFDKSGYFIIIDQANISNDLKLKQSFNLNPDLNFKIDGTGSCYMTIDENNHCHLVQLASVDNVEIYKGDSQTFRGYHSAGLGKFGTHPQFVFSSSLKNFFLTLIAINKSEEEIENFKKNIRMNNDRLIIAISSGDIVSIDL